MSLPEVIVSVASAVGVAIIIEVLKRRRPKKPKKNSREAKRLRRFSFHVKSGR